ncbi:MAG: Ig-like domain-containing protein, partial [Actinomycetia bacterium]|nr:Ig-like domain-containing protein [Actinomycetes bacterium]
MSQRPRYFLSASRVRRAMAGLAAGALIFGSVGTEMRPAEAASTADPVKSTLVFTPAAVGAGGKVNGVVTLRDSGGNPLPNHQLNWTTTNTTGGAIAAQSYSYSTDQNGTSPFQLVIPTDNDTINNGLAGGNTYIFYTHVFADGNEIAGSPAVHIGSTKVPASNTGAIEGTVYNDIDHTDTWSSRDQALTGKTVTLTNCSTGATVSSAMFSSSTTGAASTTVDSAGVYYFIGIPAGCYTVKAVSGLAAAYHLNGDKTAINVNVAAGQTMSGRNIGFTNVAQPPAVSNATASTSYNTAVTTKVTSSPLTVSSIATQASPGSCAVASDNVSVTYTPSGDGGVIDSCVFVVKDSSSGLTSQGTLTITVSPKPGLATLVVPDATASTGYKSPVTVKVTSSPMVVTAIVTQPASGSCVVAADGLSVTYTPTGLGGFTDSCVFAVTDPPTGRNTRATLKVTVAPRPGPPTANDASTTSYANGSVSKQVTTAPLIVSGISTQANPGKCTVGPDQVSVVYTPAKGGVTDSCVFVVQDPDTGLVASATLTITVSTTNKPAPTAINKTASTAWNAPVTTVMTTYPVVLSSITTQATAGTCTISADGLSTTYTPAPNNPGLYTDRCVFVITDSSTKLTSQATLQISVGRRPDPPVANNASASTTWNTPVTTKVTDSPLVVSSVATQPAHGTCAVAADQVSVTYTPTGNGGFTDTCNFVVKDPSTTLTSTATLTITVSAAGPVANDASASTSWNTPVTTKVTSSPLIVSSVATQPAHGTCAVAADQVSVTYTPTGDGSVTDTCVFVVLDPATSMTAQATLTVTVGAKPAPPVANNASASTSWNAPVTTKVTDSPLIVWSIATPPAHGTCVVATDQVSLTYTPSGNGGFTDTCAFVVKDLATTLTSTATLTITVSAAPPVANNASASTSWNTPVTTKVPSSPLVVSSVATQPAHGTCAVAADNVSVTYTPTG